MNKPAIDWRITTDLGTFHQYSDYQLQHNLRLLSGLVEQERQRFLIVSGQITFPTKT